MAEPKQIACNLNSEEFARRRKEVLEPLWRAVRQTLEIDDGIALLFDSDEGRLPFIAKMVELERQCCPFLRFAITAEPANGLIRLDITGPPGTRESIKIELGL